MSDKATPATDQTVGTWKCFLRKCFLSNPNPSGKVVVPASILASLIARIEADGERMREMEGAIQRVEREAVVHTHPVGNGVKFEGHLVPNGAMMQLLAALKEAPDA